MRDTYSYRQQQAGQGVYRIDRPLPRRMPVQWEEDLPIRKPSREPVSSVYREGRLAQHQSDIH